MLKKLALLIGVAGAAVLAKQKLAQNKDAKDLWAQAADKPAGSSH
ncbi:DLW-39 family protein [Flexivirga lutea]